MSSRFVSAGGAEIKAPEGLSNTTDQAWEKAKEQVEQARKPHERLGPAPGTQEGGVSLYDHLQAQKLAKQEAFEEASKLRNQFRPLDEAEGEFLESVKQKKQSQVADVRKETAEQLEAFRRERAAAAEKDEEKAAKRAREGKDDTISDEWTTSKKRRKVDRPPAVKPKATKLTDVPEDHEAVLLSKQSPNQQTPGDAPATKEAATSSLVAYDSDSGSDV